MPLWLDHGSLTGLGDNDHPQYALAGLTYYVDQTAGVDANDGLSTATAWKTVAKVNAATFNPGDRIFFKRGETWAEDLIAPSAGSPQGPVVFGAYGAPGARPIIGVGTNACYVNSKDDVVVEDIQFSGWTDRGVFVQNSNRVTVQRCGFTTTDDTNPVHAIRVSSSTTLLTGIRILDNVITTLGVTDNDSINRGGIITQGTYNALVRGNNVATVHTLGIVSEYSSSISGTPQSVGTVIENNDVHDCFGNLAVWHCTGTIVRNNYVHDSKGMGLGIAFASINTTVVDNLFYNLLTKSTNLWNGIDINGAAIGGIVVGNRIYGMVRHCFVIDGASTGWTVERNVFDASASVDGGISVSTILPLGNRDSAGCTGFVERDNVLIPNAGFSTGDKVASWGAGDGTRYNLAAYQSASSQGTRDTVSGDGSLSRLDIGVTVQAFEPRVTFSNAAHTVAATDRYVAQVGTMSAPRIVTLPAANAVAASSRITIADESGSVTATNFIQINRAGTDLINGAVYTAVLAPYGMRVLVSDGTSKWTTDLETVDRANNLSDLFDLSAARTNLGLAIGTNVQAYDGDLAAIAALATTSYGRSVLAAADEAALGTLIAIPKEVTFSRSGNATVMTGTTRWYADRNYTIGLSRASAGVAPTGQSLIADVNKNGTTIFTTQASRPTIAATTNTDVSSAPDVTTLTAGDYLTVDFDQIGTTLPGANVSVQIGLTTA